MGTLAYFMMMSQNLVNNLDGIWHPSNFIAGDWEISLGRGLQRYADRARFGIVSDPFNTVLTLLLLSIANAIILRAFSIDSPVYKGILLMLLSVNPVVCHSLSYSYMSVNFGLAYLFSVAAFACIRKIKGWKLTLTLGSLGGLFLGISMAFYQAYICVTGVLVIISALNELCREKNAKKTARYITAGLYSFLCGGILYYLITQALLYRAGISLASYKGAANITPALILIRLPQSLQRCYSEFFSYYWERKAFSHLEFIDIVLMGITVVYLTAVIIQLTRLIKHSLAAAALFIILFLSLPVSCCLVLLIAVGNSMTGLMSMGLVICLALLGIVVPSEGNSGFFLKRINLLLLAAFIWFQLSATVNDQLALKEGKTATITLTENIISQLSMDGYLDTSQPVALIGRPADNDLFTQSTAYLMANEYARFGCWSTDARNNRVSWTGVISNFLGINLNLCGDSEYQELIRLKQVADMPEFPCRGSICIIHDIVVVKVSDVY